MKDIEILYYSFLNDHLIAASFNANQDSDLGGETCAWRRGKELREKFGG